MYGEMFLLFFFSETTEMSMECSLNDPQENTHIFMAIVNQRWSYTNFLFCRADLKLQKNHHSRKHLKGPKWINI